MIECYNTLLITVKEKYTFKGIQTISCVNFEWPGECKYLITYKSYINAVKTFCISNKIYT